MVPARASVLIADDSPEARTVLEAHLAAEGYQLHYAADGFECLAKTASVSPDLILLDVMMPGLDGLQVVRRLRADRNLALTPVILITALEDRATRLEGLEAGADDFLSKPVDPLELQVRVRTVLRLNRYRRLIEEKTKFEQLVEHTTDGVALTDEAGRLIEWNASLERITGLGRTDALQRPAWEVLLSLLPEERHAREASRRLADSMRRLAQSGPMREAGQLVEAEIQCPDGARRFVQAGPFAVPTAWGWRAGLVVRDLTEQRAAEAARLTMAQRFENFIKYANDIILLGDADRRIVEANDRALEAYGYSREAILSLNLVDLVAPNDVAGFPQRLHALQAQGTLRIEGLHRRSDGSTFPVEISARIIDIGGQRFYQQIVRDITERVDADAARKKAEDERRRLMETLEQSVAERTRELSSLYQAARLAAAMRDLPSSLPRALQLALDAVGCPAGMVVLAANDAVTSLPPDEAAARRLPPLRLAAELGLLNEYSVSQSPSVPIATLLSWILEHGEAVVVPDLSVDPRVSETDPVPHFQFFAGAPLRQGAAAVGVLGVFGSARQPFSLESLALLRSLADQISGMVERDRLQQQAEAAAALQERQRLARDLHDSVTQSLYSFALLADVARKDFRRGDLARLDNTLANVSFSAQQALKEMRLLLYELRPPTLAPGSLPALLEQRLESVERHARLEAHLSVEGEVRSLPVQWETDLYRLAEEALNNALKHGRASAVQVHLAVAEAGVVLEVVDNGIGFAVPAAASSGHGLTSMRERTARLGGKLSIISAPGAGTTVRAEFPKSNPKRRPNAS